MASSDAGAAGEKQPDGLSIQEEEDMGYYADIGVNLTDPVFSGLYHGKQAHESDLADVIQRARDVGCRALMVTGSDLEASGEAVELAGEYPDICKATIGVHPCSSRIFEDHPNGTQGVLNALADLIRSASASTSGTAASSPQTNNDVTNRAPLLAAIGEIGLDYDRLSLSPKETQLHAFKAQLELLTSVLYPAPSNPNSAAPTCPPLFLHSRSSHPDFLSILTTHAPPSLLPNRGIVHSFTGTPSEMHDLLLQGWDIGINGCSVRSAEGIEVVKELPLDRMHLETDAPWCEVRASSVGWQLLLAKLEEEDEAEREAERARGLDRSGRRRERVKDAKEGAGYKSVKKEKWVRGAMVKGRNEPCRIVEVARIVAAVKGVEVQVVRRKAWGNWRRMFGVSNEQ